MVVAGASRGRSGRRGDDLVGERLFARSPQHERRKPAGVAQERRELAESLGRPALVRPRRAGIDQRERPIGPICRRTPSSAADATLASGNVIGVVVDADRAQQLQVLADDVRRSSSLSASSGIERTRGLLAQVPDRESDDPRRARRARENGRLHQPLEIDRDVVRRAAQLRG